MPLAVKSPLAPGWPVFCSNISGRPVIFAATLLADSADFEAKFNLPVECWAALVPVAAQRKKRKKGRKRNIPDGVERAIRGHLLIVDSSSRSAWEETLETLLTKLREWASLSFGKYESVNKKQGLSFVENYIPLS